MQISIKDYSECFGKIRSNQYEIKGMWKANLRFRCSVDVF